MSETTKKPESKPKHRRRHPLDECGKEVAERASALQTKYMRGSSEAMASMAELRRSVNKSPGENPAIWELTQVGSDKWRPDEPTAEEWAVHLSLTLFAMHQQGRSQPAFVPGISLGQAVSLLKADNHGNDSVWKRFAAVLSATSINGVREHLQAIIGQLHSNSLFVGFDYATLADDLVKLQNPRLSNRIRLQWERDYYTPIKDSSDSKDQSPEAKKA